MIGRHRAPLFALFTAEAISRTGSALTSLAIPWFVLETTGSTARLGLTAGVESVALVAAGFLGGPIVDQLGFKWSAIATDVTSGIMVALVPLLYMTVGLPFWQLLILAAMASLFSVPDLAAHLGLVSPLTDAAEMSRERANAASQSIANLARLVGPVAGGALIAALGASNVLSFDAASFAISATLIASLIPRLSDEEILAAQETNNEAMGPPSHGMGYLSQLVEGMRFIWHEEVIVRVVAASVVINLAYVPVLSVVLVVYAERVLSGAVDLGFMFGGFGVGGLTGSMLYGAVGHRLPRRATLAAANISLSLSTGVLVITPPLAVTVAVLVLAGMALGPGNPIIYTVTQERTPDSLLGRVFGTQIALSNAVVPVGVMLVGFLLDVVGLRLILATVAATILAAAVYTGLSPELAGMDERYLTERNGKSEG